MFDGANQEHLSLIIHIGIEQRPIKNQCIFLYLL